MPLQPIDVQTNIAQMDKLGQDLNKIQLLAEREQSHAAKIFENFSKEIEHKLIKANQLDEDRRVKEYKNDDEKDEKFNRKKKKKTQLAYQEIENKIIDSKTNQHPFKGIFIDILD